MQLTIILPLFTFMILTCWEAIKYRP